jgi:hypothetical protein
MSDGLDNLLGDSDSHRRRQRRRQPAQAAGAGAPAGEGGQRPPGQLEATQRQGQLTSLLEKHAVPALAADFFPKDAELNDEAITAFVGKYGQLWGHQAAPATTPPEQQAATQVIQQVTSQATTPPAGVPLTEEQYRQKFAEAKSPDELMQLIAQLGA